ncbi:MAG: hypothetical protein R2828_11995 [Saprospiraceae bacterium]
MRNYSLLTLAFLSSMIWLSCGTSTPEATQAPDPYQHIQDEQVKRVLGAAIEKAGGLASWRNIQSLRFQKDYALLTETGDTESAALQTHTYTFHPSTKVLMEWEADGKALTITYEDGTAVQSIDGKPDPSAKTQALIDNVLSSTFVISVPFKLLDEGVQLSYAGLDTLAGNRVVEVIRAVYNPVDNASHSTPDTWWHYYDAKDFTFLAYMVQHADHFSYVENLSFHTVDGFMFPHERKSYRADSLRNILYLRADYKYEGFEVEKI